LGATQHRCEFLAANSAQIEQQEGIVIELLGQQIVNRRDMLARVGRIRATTGGNQVVFPRRKEWHTRFAEI
jgi:hypothetical protein